LHSVEISTRAVKKISPPFFKSSGEDRASPLLFLGSDEPRPYIVIIAYIVGSYVVARFIELNKPNELDNYARSKIASFGVPTPNSGNIATIANPVKSAVGCTH
jgi:hypothetical protein